LSSFRCPGGYGCSGACGKAEVLKYTRSSNSWSTINGATSWGQRWAAHHTAIYYNSVLLLFGGHVNAGGTFGDVQASGNGGISWTQAQSSAFCAQTYHTVARIGGNTQPNAQAFIYGGSSSACAPVQLSGSYTQALNYHAAISTPDFAAITNSPSAHQVANLLLLYGGSAGSQSMYYLPLGQLHGLSVVSAWQLTAPINPPTLTTVAMLLPPAFFQITDGINARIRLRATILDLTNITSSYIVTAFAASMPRSAQNVSVSDGLLTAPISLSFPWSTVWIDTIEGPYSVNITVPALKSVRIRNGGGIFVAYNPGAVVFNSTTGVREYFYTTSANLTSFIITLETISAAGTTSEYQMNGAGAWTALSSGTVSNYITVPNAGANILRIRNMADRTIATFQLTRENNAAGIVGDPSFTGFRFQQFQVHGVPESVSLQFSKVSWAAPYQNPCIFC
jgi:hypothetical protein